MQQERKDDDDGYGRTRTSWFSVREDDGRRSAKATRFIYMANRLYQDSQSSTTSIPSTARFTSFAQTRSQAVS